MLHSPGSRQRKWDMLFAPKPLLRGRLLRHHVRRGAAESRQRAGYDLRAVWLGDPGGVYRRVCSGGGLRGMLFAAARQARGRRALADRCPCPTPAQVAIPQPAIPRVTPIRTISSLIILYSEELDDGTYLYKS